MWTPEITFLLRLCSRGNFYNEKKERGLEKGTNQSFWADGKLLGESERSNAQDKIKIPDTIGY